MPSTKLTTPTVGITNLRNLSTFSAVRWTVFRSRWGCSKRKCWLHHIQLYLRQYRRSWNSLLIFINIVSTLILKRIHTNPKAYIFSMIKAWNKNFHLHHRNIKTCISSLWQILYMEDMSENWKYNWRSTTEILKLEPLYFRRTGLRREPNLHLEATFSRRLA